MSVTNEVIRTIRDSVIEYLRDTEYLIYSLEEDKLDPVVLNMFHLIGIKPSVKDVKSVLKQIKIELEDSFHKELKEREKRIKETEHEIELQQKRLEDRKKELNDFLKKKNKKEPKKKK